MRIRRSTPRDGARAVEIWRSAVDATHHFLLPEDRVALDVEVRNFLPRTAMWLAVDAEDRAVAFMLVWTAKIEGLFVDPAHHRRGVGRALVDHALVASPVLDVDVNEQNPEALAFYRRLGFVETGRSPLDAQGRAYPLIHLRLDTR